MNIYMLPTELMQLHDEHATGLSNSEYIRSPQNQHLKDVWCAARFALGYERYLKKSCLVRVNDIQNSDTDFFLKFDSKEFPFQTTIADVPERKMGDEHREVTDDAPRSFPYEPERHRIEGSSWIATAIEHKLEMNYSNLKSLNLLVYANLSAHYQTYSSICSGVRDEHKKFNSIWIITNHQICSVYSSPELGSIASLVDISDWKLASN